MPKLKTTNRFSYDWVSDATRADYDAMLDADALAFLRSVPVTAGGRPLEKSFQGWWMTKGPTSFATPDDTFRYRRELWARVRAIVVNRELLATPEAAPPEPAP